MFTLNTITDRTKWLFQHCLREMTYTDMSHQASDWIPEQLRIESEKPQQQPIKLNFDVPKRHRLNWMRRTISQLPR